MAAKTAVLVKRDGLAPCCVFTRLFACREVGGLGRRVTKVHLGMMARVAFSVGAEICPRSSISCGIYKCSLDGLLAPCCICLKLGFSVRVGERVHSDACTRRAGCRSARVKVKVSEDESGEW